MKDRLGNVSEAGTLEEWLSAISNCAVEATESMLPLLVKLDPTDNGKWEHDKDIFMLLMLKIAEI